LRKGLVYYHGGAFAFGSAEEEDPWACRLTLECDIVIFNVEYRNAPEARAPQGILDCYAALKYVMEHLTARFHVDVERLGVYGISSGGYLAVGVAMELAKRREASRVKLLIADVPAISDHWARPSSMVDSAEVDTWHWSQFEVENWHGTHGHIETLKMLADNWERQVRESDPHLFPGVMSEALLRKTPKQVVMTREFDFLRADAELYADRLRRCGRLLDFYIRPGVSHYNGPQGGVLKKILDAYL
jgi:acetyl esterase